MLVLRGATQVESNEFADVVARGSLSEALVRTTSMADLCLLGTLVAFVFSLPYLFC